MRFVEKAFLYPYRGKSSRTDETFGLERPIYVRSVVLNLADVASLTPDVGTSAGSVGKLDSAENGKLIASLFRQKGPTSDQIQLDVSDSFQALTTGFVFFDRPLLHLLDFRCRRIPPRWGGQNPPHGGTLSAICPEPKRMSDADLKNTMPDKKIDLIRRQPTAIEVPISGLLLSGTFQLGHGFESVVGESIGTRKVQHFPRGANAIFGTFPDILASRHFRASESNLPGLASLRLRRR